MSILCFCSNFHLSVLSLFKQSDVFWGYLCRFLVLLGESFLMRSNIQLYHISVALSMLLQQNGKEDLVQCLLSTRQNHSYSNRSRFHSLVFDYSSRHELQQGQENEQKSQTYSRHPITGSGTKPDSTGLRKL